MSIETYILFVCFGPWVFTMLYMAVDVAWWRFYKLPRHGRETE